MQPLDLSGTWQFQLDPDGTLNHEQLNPTQTIRVPLPWQAAMPELRSYSGYAWYLREFAASEELLAGEALLHFGAVDYWCQVWLNDTLVGEHEGGYTPFSFLVGKQLRPGSNTLTLRVYDSAQNAIVVERWHTPAASEQSGPPFDARDVPHGKQEWYINVGGIWQDVTLTAVPQVFVSRIHVTPNITTSTATLDVAFRGDLTLLENATLRLAITDSSGERVAEQLSLNANQGHERATLTIATPRLWNLHDPHLYTASATLEYSIAANKTGSGEQNSPSVSSVSSVAKHSHTHTARFGMRSFGYENGQFLLNGEPFFLLCALDQDLYPDTIYTVPSEEFLRDQFIKAKELGLNSLRCHIKPPDPRYLDIADELGLLIWSEVPSWRTFPVKGMMHTNEIDLPEIIRQRAERTLEELVERDFNHPALVIWTLVNEDWGTSLYFSASDRAWLAQFYQRCKQLDPTRLAVDNSPCGGSWGPNIHVQSDIDDFHVYMSIPDTAQSWELAMEQFALRPLWTYSAHGDTQRNGQEPLVLSEFGNWGLPSLEALRSYHGGEPHWFDLGPWWSRWEGEPGWPQGVEERFAQLGLHKLWSDYETFARATQMHQFEAMKLEIEAMRRQPTLAGYVITEFTDAYWESNGLLDFARNPKAYHHLFKQVNNTDVVVPLPERRAYWSDERPRVAVYVSHYSGAMGDGATLRWQIEGTPTQGELALPPQARGDTRQVCTLRLPLPEVDAARSAVLALTLVGPDGNQITANQLQLAVYPPAARRPASEEPVAVISGEGFTLTNPEMPPMIDPAASELPLEPQIEETAQPVPSGSRDRPLRPIVAGAGYRVAEQLGPEVKLAISNRPTAELLHWVREGGDLLFLSEGMSPFFYTQGRSGAYGGNWITSYGWAKPEIHPRLGPENPLGMAFSGVMPLGAIVGLPLEDATYHDDVLAGMVIGWVGHPAAYTVQFRYGKGRVVMTTFRLREMVGRNPTATAMLHDLLEHLHSERCQPTLRANY